jgi:radical SAM protein with 4Fe4S-binding SPASM domain
MCGRRQREKLLGPQNYGHMEFGLVERIAAQTPPGMMVQLHNNGEPLMYSKFGEAVDLFAHCTTNTVTNGLLLFEKRREIVDKLDTLSVSIIENEIPSIKDYQYETLPDFLKFKGYKKPFVTLRFVGKVDEQPYKKLNLLHVRRTLHRPEGSVGYRKQPTIPEIGICMDFLTRLAIDRFGNVSTCVRFCPEGELIIGKIPENTLEECWNSEKRLQMKKLHLSGRRGEIEYCGNKCDYWGVPTAD